MCATRTIRCGVTIREKPDSQRLHHEHRLIPIYEPTMLPTRDSLSIRRDTQRVIRDHLVEREYARSRILLHHPHEHTRVQDDHELGHDGDGTTGHHDTGVTYSRSEQGGSASAEGVL